ncbi:MAG TPA: glycogen-binding domain-containing protein [Longimicrobium sp.]|nr:glycogen-binding domain-containing protein [Longimicrobium sp.]
MTLGRTAALALVLLLPLPLLAQGWTLDAAAGRAVHDPVSARVSSTAASLGLSWDGGEGSRWVYLSAGAPLGDAGPAWGAGGAGAWLSLTRGDFTVGTTLAAHVFGYGAADSVRSGSGATLEALPGIVFSRGPLRVELSSGVVATTDAAGDSSRARTVHQSDGRLALTDGAGVEIAAVGRFLRTDQGDWPYAGGTARVERGRVGGWAFAGRWLKDEGFPAPRTAYGAGVSYEVLPRTRVLLDWRQEPLDPVYLNSPRRSWSVQVSRAFGRAAEGAGRPAAPGRAGAEPGAAGWVVFRLPVRQHPAAPALIGDFTGWSPVAMTEEDGYWTARVRTGSGVHHYAFRAPDGTVFVPAYLPAVNDGFGGASALVVVP